MFERGLQRQAKACPHRYMVGRGREGEEGKGQEGGVKGWEGEGGRLSISGRGEKD